MEFKFKNYKNTMIKSKSIKFIQIFLKFSTFKPKEFIIQASKD